MALLDQLASSEAALGTRVAFHALIELTGVEAMRLIVCTAVAGALLAMTVSSHAQSYDDRFYGGGPLHRLLGMSGSSGPIAKTTVSFAGNYNPGTIIINTGERRLYYVLGGGQAIRYGIGVGRVGFTWAGTTAVSAKKEWPDWTPPAQMRARRHGLPAHMAGGIDNPLGGARDVSRILALSHPRLQRAGDDRTGGLVGLFPHDQRRRHRPLQPGQCRGQGDRGALRGSISPGQSGGPAFRSRAIETRNNITA